MATDSRATAGNWIASQTVKKVIEINSCLLGTMAGGAAVSSPNPFLVNEALFRTIADMIIPGLSILACISGNAMSAPRAPPQASYLRRSSIEDPRKPRLFI